mmetsp:Transcript_83429/g.244610  ORF Transcript_83429/g.244610 Transcript_83429/m.244610 type:complete len:289 (-) Transcript_83429:337-1203(-)
MVEQATILLVREVPHLKEGRSVQPGVSGHTCFYVQSHLLLLDRRDDDSLDLCSVWRDADQFRLAPIAEDAVLVTREDAGVHPLLGLHQWELVAVSPHHLDAKKRGVTPRGGGRGGRRDGPRCRGPRDCDSGGRGVSLAGTEGLPITDRTFALVQGAGGNPQLSFVLVAALRPFKVTLVDTDGAVKVAQSKACILAGIGIHDGVLADVHASTVHESRVRNCPSLQDLIILQGDGHVPRLVEQREPLAPAPANNDAARVLYGQYVGLEVAVLPYVGAALVDNLPLGGAVL